MPDFNESKDDTIKWLIKLNEEKTLEVMKLEEEIKKLKKLIALREEYK